jgi:long-chain acyl-CoA synthetase
MTHQHSLFAGIISGERRRGHGEVAKRVGRIAGGLHEFGVRPGDSVCMLMRNDIAFIEAAYAAMRLGAYGVRGKYDMSSLRHVIHAAAPCPADVKRAMIEWWGPVIHEFYGSTESGAVTFANSGDALQKPGTVGRIAPGAELRFVGDDGKPLPQGEIGEIYSRIAGNPDFTYHNKPEKRAEIERDGFITSGDVGYIDADGYVFICDRKRDMVISGGVNIYPAEIEAVLHAIPGVHDCAVFGIPDDEFGEALMAVVEPQPGVMLDVADIRARLKVALADYKVPKHVEIDRNLPREDSGKIFKRRLRDPFWERTGRRI